MRSATKASVVLLTLGILVILGGNVIFGQGLQPSEKTEYRLSKEMRYDKPVGRVVFGTARTDREAVFYPKVVVVRKGLLDQEVEFRDVDRSLVARIPVDENGLVHISKHGRFIGIEKLAIPPEIERTDPDAYKFAKTHLEVYDDRGEMVWRSAGPIATSEESYGVYISDTDGYAVADRLEYGGIDFYDVEGERRTVEPFGRMGWARRSATGDFSEDGRYFAVVASELPMMRYEELPGKSPNPWLILYEKDGDEVWRRPFGEYIGDKVLVSPSGKYIMVCGHTMAGVSKGAASKGSFLYDDQGRVVMEEPGLFQMACFSSDEKYAAIGQGNKVILIETKHGKRVFEKEVPHRIVYMDLPGTGQYLALEARRQFTPKVDESVPVRQRRARIMELKRQFSADDDDSEIFILNQRGELVWSRRFPGQVTSKEPMLCAISPDGRQFALKFEDNTLAIFERKVSNW